jgi:succinate dehydrogenase / fumarate reductase flavoprotein subunit
MSVAYKTVKADVLVIGSGAAGLRTAIEAHSRGIDTLVLGKCGKGDAHTVLATGGINAALGTMDPEDNWLVHAADTVKEGRFIADPYEVELLCRGGPQAIQDLVDYGIKFHRERDGRLTQRFFGAHTFRRTCFVGDETGKAIEEVLVRKAGKLGIPFLGDVYITDLLTAGGKVSGALGFDMLSGELVAFHAKATVLATGGHSRLYRRSSSRIFENTGDGITLAYNVGAIIEDMEMLQFHPTGMVWPAEAEGVLVTESVRGEGGILTNAKGERFARKYHPRGELGPRDVVARAIYSEVAAGRGTRHGGAWLDISHRPKKYILERLPKMYRQFKQFLGIDISKQRMEVAPTAHYSMGGIRVDRKTNQATSVPGLFGVGEVTSGVHGANRLGGNSLLECIVFGRIGGAHVAKFSKSHGFKPLNERQIEKSAKRLALFARAKGRFSPQELRAELQESMWKDAGIVRDARGLKHGLGKLADVRKKFARVHVNGKGLGENPDLVVALDVENLFIPAEAVLCSALARRESRGAHFRSDFPRESPRGLFNVVCSRGPSGMRLGRRRVARPKGALAGFLARRPKARTEELKGLDITEGL